jgi:hypothetical protein
MSGLWSLVLGGLALAAPPEKSQPLRYLKLADGRFVTESEVTETRTETGSSFASRTERERERMTLTLTYDERGKLLSAEAALDTGSGRRPAALLSFPGKRVQLRRSGGITEFLTKITPDVVVTTAPDWSDIFQLVRRYDAKKAGRQEFPGLWIHPNYPAKTLTFSIENTGKDTIAVKDKKIGLDRYRVHLRSGDYLVWADSNGRVYKLMVPGKPATSVVLEGYQEETRDLGK